MADIMNPFTEAEVKFYPLEEATKAKAWITA